MDVILDRYVASLLPSRAADAQQLSRLGERHAATLGPDGTWPDVAYDDPAASAWEARHHLDRTLVIAKAYYQSRTAGTPAAPLLAAARTGLRAWLDRDPRNPNWWWNEIGVPQLVGQVMALLRPDLPEADLGRGLAVMRRNDWSRHAGANLVWGVNLQALRACLTGDEDSGRLLDEAYARLYREIRVEAHGHEGIQADLSFHQHGPQFYSGGYGLSFGNDVARLIAQAWGTTHQVPDAEMGLFGAFLLDGQQWMIRGQVFDYSAVGREITREGKTAVPLARAGEPPGAAYGLLDAVEMLAVLPVPRRQEFEAFGARLRGDPDVPPLVGNRHFWNSDYMAHHRRAYFASVRMFSSRTINTENTNREGPKSHHLADGATLIYRTGDEYREIFPVWDWDRVPGTTAELGFREANPKENCVKGTTSFVGGASDGTRGIAAMHLARGALTARKAWVMLDRAIVCLGADIDCDTDGRVLTSLNQCHLIGDVTTGDAPAALPNPTATTVGGAGWVHHDGIGYLVPGSATVRLEAGERTGRWSDIGTGRPDVVRHDVFALWFDHGTRVHRGSYEYALLPGATAAQTASAAAGPSYEVIANDAARQVVFDAREAVLAAAFWTRGTADAGEGWRATVDQPCLLLLTEVRDGPYAGAVRLTVANPENRPLAVTVRLSRRLEGPQCTVDDGTAVRIDMPDGPRAGASVTVVLRPRH